MPTTDQAAGSAPLGALSPLPSSQERKPMKLQLVFVFGSLTSLVAICGLIWLFAAYEAGNVWPWSYEPRISQDKWFEIIRNAVTMAAALGVGITLFFGYRRQQTAELNQRVSVEAQLTAARAQQTTAAALELSNRQHALDQGRRQDAVTAELRTRYAQTAEQLGSSHLPVRLAGVYSMAALADDWAELGHEDERQVCIDLLCAYFRSAQPGEDAAVRRELADATLQVIMERLRTAAPQRKSWGGSRIQLQGADQLPGLRKVSLNRGGQLLIADAVVEDFVLWRGIELNNARLVVTGLRSRSPLTIVDAHLMGSRAMFSLSVQKSEAENRAVAIRFRNLTLDSGQLRIYAPGSRVTFVGCTFNEGALIINTMADRASVGRDSVTFNDCNFAADVFSDGPFAHGNGGPTPGLYTSTLRVGEDCRFTNGASTVVSASMADQS